MLFSVIVPIYKVEKYLPQCIESVLNQSFTDYELILVNDGSPDNSGAICDRYAQKDRRIKVIHKDNGGLSDARNHGLAIAEGEFVWFLDGDDYMAESAMENVADLIKSNPDLDMITCAHIKASIDGNTVSYVPSLINETGEIVFREEYINRLCKSKGSNWAAWKNIYRNSVIKKHGIKFEKGLIGAEDCDFFMRYVRYADKFAYFNRPIVYYRINREGSITNTMSKPAIMGQLAVFKDNYCLYEKYNNAGMKVFFANKFANTVSLLPCLENEADISDVTGFIKDNIRVLKESKGLKYSIAKLVWSAFGYYKGSRILQVFRKRIA